MLYLCRKDLANQENGVLHKSQLKNILQLFKHEIKFFFPVFLSFFCV